MTCYLVMLVAMVVTITVHEFGHGAAATIIGCTEIRSVIYSIDHTTPYTSMLCSGGEKITLISGLLATTIFGLMLLTSTDSAILMLGIMIISFGFAGSYNDLIELGVSFPFIGAAILTIAVIVSIVGTQIYKKSLED